MVISGCRAANNYAPSKRESPEVSGDSLGEGGGETSRPPYDGKELHLRGELTRVFRT